MSSTHKDIKPSYSCFKCKKLYVSIRGVSSHYPHCVPSVVSDPLEFSCESCDFSCSTKIGFGLHNRHRHPAILESSKGIDRVKARWSSEELNILATRELELPTGCRNINQRLLEAFPERSLETIKGQCNKNPQYIRIREDLRTKNLASVTPIRRRQLPTLPDIPSPTMRRRQLPPTPLNPSPVLERLRSSQLLNITSPLSTTPSTIPLRRRT